MQWKNIETPKHTTETILVSETGKRAVEKAMATDPVLAAMIIVALLEAEAAGYDLGRRQQKAIETGCL